MNFNVVSLFGRGDLYGYTWGSLIDLLSSTYGKSQKEIPIGRFRVIELSAIVGGVF